MPRSENVERALSGIPWRELNEKFKSYNKVLEEVFKIAESRGLSRVQLEEFVKEVYNKVLSLRVYLID
ncbi:MAG: hypothetical protein QXN05_02665 [Acidilobaceae archaeon]